MPNSIITSPYLFLQLLCSIKAIFRRVLTSCVKKGLTVLQNVLLSVTSVAVILPKNICFAFLVRLTQ